VFSLELSTDPLSEESEKEKAVIQVEPIITGLPLGSEVSTCMFPGIGAQNSALNDVNSNVTPTNFQNAPPSNGQSSPAEILDEHTTRLVNQSYVDDESKLFKQLSGLTDARFNKDEGSSSIQILPFHCKVDIIGLDQPGQEISITLWLKIKSLHESEAIVKHRCLCHVTAEKFEAQIAALDEETKTALRLREIHLHMGPTVHELNRTDYDVKIQKRSFETIDQQPQKKHLVSEGSTEGQDVTTDARMTYPGPSIGRSLKQGRTISRPASVVGIDIDLLEIGCRKRSQLFWRYPVLPKAAFIPESPLTRHAQFENHHGKFVYLSNKVPDSLRIEVEVLCSLPSLAQVKLLERFRAAITPNYILHKETKYPCRDIRLRLQVDILPTERNLFIFPREGLSGRSLDLGSFKFVENAGQLGLEVDRGEDGQFSIPDPHAWNVPFCFEQGNWMIRTDKIGELRIRERSAIREICPTEATLQFAVTDIGIDKKKATKRKSARETKIIE